MDDLEVNGHLDSTSEITLDIVKKKALKGVIILVSKNVIVQLVSFFVGFLLTVFLNPNQFGTFYLIQAAIGFFNYFSDIGLAAAVIQKKESLERNELKTTFTIQNCLVIILLIIIFLTTPFFKELYKLDQTSIYLLWTLGFCLLCSSLQSIPSALLERELDYNRQAIPSMISTIIFQLISVVLAWKGYGITSFTVALLVSNLVSLVLMYILKPWKPGLALDFSSVKGLLNFGLPYQINTILALVKDNLMQLFLGAMLGTNGLGFLSWAKKWPTAPLNFFMDPVTKVTFPAISRMQDHREELSKAVSKSLFFICSLVFPALAVLVFTAPILVQLIPKYSKWEPALLTLDLIVIMQAWATVTTPLMNTLNAIGKIKTTFYFMIMWTVLTWILVPTLSSLYGLNGAAAGYALVGSSSIIAILTALRSIKINLWQGVGKPFLATSVMILILVLGRIIFSPSWISLFLAICPALIIYAIVIFLLSGSSLFEDIKKSYYLLTTKKAIK